MVVDFNTMVVRTHGRGPAMLTTMMMTDARRSEDLDQDDDQPIERSDPEPRMPCDGRCVPEALPDTFARAMKALTQPE